MATQFTENDVIDNPITTLHALCDTSTNMESLLDAYQHLLTAHINKVPPVNTSADSVNKLVYTRGMIQNLSDPILYSSAVSLRHNSSTDTRSVPVIFMEDYSPPENWTILHTPNHHLPNNTSESILIHSVPVPNETEWCKHEWPNQQNEDSTHTKPIQIMAYNNLSTLLLNKVCLFYGVYSVSDQILHCLYFKEVTFQSPLNREYFNSAKTSLREIRNQLLNQLLFCAAGDKLTAEYLLFNLISRNYARYDVTQLGKFSLNLIHSTPNTSQLISQLYPRILERFLYLPLSLSFLNDKAFLPKKDYSSEQLTTGCLQLVDNTFILIDETRMESGRLSSSGVASLSALTELIEAQCVYYDFTYHKLPFNVDTPILILTEGNKSLLPSTAILPVLPSGDVMSRPDLANNTLEDIRRYLTTVRTMDYNLDVELQELVQADWVEMRKGDKELTADDLTRLLTTARYLSISRGDCHLLQDTWNEVKQFECERRARLKQIK